MKTNKHRTLLLTKSQGTITSRDLRGSMNIPQVQQGPICRICGGKAYWQGTTASTRSQKRATAAYGISLFLVADGKGAHFALGSWGT